ncbi:hypothetical protein CJF32_00000270 [Rutstroemia sp. NJR-2017a WRK4]|nr:hypothetical protein CJF32_00000270 [Rutstroemia sp. NJR-2017a WRK4]
MERTVDRCILPTTPSFFPPPVPISHQLPCPPPPIHTSKFPKSWDDDISPSTAAAPSARSSITLKRKDEDFDLEAAMSPSDSLTDDPNARPKCFSSWIEEWIFVFTVMLASCSTTFLQGVILINTATIGRSLDMTPAQVTWIAAAIGLASGSFMLLFGSTADLLGRKMQLLTGLFSLSIFSLLSAFSPSPIPLLLLCGLLGLGTACVSPPAIGTLFATYPEGRRRNLVTGVLGCGNPVGFILGSVSSGLATKYYGWRASFMVVAGFFFLMAVAAVWAVPSLGRKGNVRRAVRRFDYVGAGLTVLGMALLTAGLTEAPQRGWLTPRTLLTLLSSLILLLLFLIWEYFYAHPLLPLTVFRNRNFSLCVLCTAFGYMSFITNEFWIALYMQDVQHLTALQIAVRMMPQAIAGVVWSFWGQSLVRWVSGTVLMGIGAAAYVLGAGLLLGVKVGVSYWWFLFPALCITVVGADFQFIVSNLYITSHLPTQSSLGAGIIQTAYRLSISIGLAITSAIYATPSQSTLILSPDAPFQNVYFCSLGFAIVGCLFVPFMRLGTGGERELGQNNQNTKPTGPVQEKDTPDSGWDTAETRVGTADGDGERKIGLPRWSWEDRPRGRILRKGFVGCEGRNGSMCGSQDSGEMCGKCLLERRVLGSSANTSEEKIESGGSGSMHVEREGQGEGEVEDEVESITRTIERMSRVVRRAPTV